MKNQEVEFEQDTPKDNRWAEFMPGFGQVTNHAKFWDKSVIYPKFRNRKFLMLRIREQFV